MFVKGLCHREKGVSCEESCSAVGRAHSCLLFDVDVGNRPIYLAWEKIFCAACQIPDVQQPFPIANVFKFSRSMKKYKTMSNRLSNGIVDLHLSRLSSLLGKYRGLQLPL